MAILTPIDLVHRQNQFETRKSVDGDEVARFLEEVREAWEAALRDNARLRDDLRQRMDEIASLRAQQEEITETLVLARRMTLDIESTARREADVLVGEARLEAERLLAVATEQHRSLQEELLRLKAARLNHLAQMRAIVDAHGRMLDELDPRD
jgi:cell division initiation protein